MVLIIGTGHSGFGRLPDSFEDLIVTIAREVLNEIGIAPAKISSIWLRHFNTGRVADGFSSSLEMAAHPGLRCGPRRRGSRTPVPRWQPRSAGRWTRSTRGRCRRRL